MKPLQYEEKQKGKNSDPDGKQSLVFQYQSLKKTLEEAPVFVYTHYEANGLTSLQLRPLSRLDLFKVLETTVVYADSR